MQHNSCSNLLYPTDDPNEKPRFAHWVEKDCGDFRFLSDRKWIARQSFYINFASAFDRLTTATYSINISKRWSRDRRDCCFRSRYFRFRSGGKPRVFKVNIRADSYLGPILTRSRAEYHPGGLGLDDHFRSCYFRFRWVQEGGAGNRHGKSTR